MVSQVIIFQVKISKTKFHELARSLSDTFAIGYVRYLLRSLSDTVLGKKKLKNEVRYLPDLRVVFYHPRSKGRWRNDVLKSVNIANTHESSWVAIHNYFFLV